MLDDYKKTVFPRGKKGSIKEIVMRIFVGEIGHQNIDNSELLNCLGACHSCACVGKSNY